MGESAAETVREIEDVRSRLDGELRELEERLPSARTTKRVAGVLLTGGTGTITLWMIRRARARRRKEPESAAVRAVVQVVPDRWAKQVSESLADDGWKRPAAYAAGAWVIFKLAEARQLRKMNRLLASRP